MTNQTKLIDYFAKVSDNCTATNCHSGFVVDVSGQDNVDNWISAKFVFKTLVKLKDIVQELTWIPKFLRVGNRNQLLKFSCGNI